MSGFSLLTPEGAAVQAGFKGGPGGRGGWSGEAGWHTSARFPSPGMKMCGDGVEVRVAEPCNTSTESVHFGHFEVVRLCWVDYRDSIKRSSQALLVLAGLKRDRWGTCLVVQWLRCQDPSVGSDPCSGN